MQNPSPRLDLVEKIADEQIRHELHCINPDGRIFLTDLDGVVFDWMGDFCRYLVKEHAWVDPGLPMSMAHDFVEQFRMPLDELKPKIDAFQCSPSAGRLTVYPDALEVMPRIVHELGYRFVGVTSAGTHPDIVQNRQRCIEAFFPGLFSELYILPPLVSKSSVLTEFEPTFWVDDHPRHVHAGMKAGHTSLWLHRPGLLETEDPDLETFPDWHAVYDRLTMSDMP